MLALYVTSLRLLTWLLLSSHSQTLIHHQCAQHSDLSNFMGWSQYRATTSTDDRNRVGVCYGEKLQRTPGIVYSNGLFSVVIWLVYVCMFGLCDRLTVDKTQQWLLISKTFVKLESWPTCYFYFTIQMCQSEWMGLLVYLPVAVGL